MVEKAYDFQHIHTLFAAHHYNTYYCLEFEESEYLSILNLLNQSMLTLASNKKIKKEIKLHIHYLKVDEPY